MPVMIHQQQQNQQYQQQEQEGPQQQEFKKELQQENQVLKEQLKMLMGQLGQDGAINQNMANMVLQKRYPQQQLSSNWAKQQFQKELQQENRQLRQEIDNLIGQLEYYQQEQKREQLQFEQEMQSSSGMLRNQEQPTYHQNEDSKNDSPYQDENLNHCQNFKNIQDNFMSQQNHQNLSYSRGSSPSIDQFDAQNQKLQQSKQLKQSDLEGDSKQIPSSKALAFSLSLASDDSPDSKLILATRKNGHQLSTIEQIAKMTNDMSQFNNRNQTSATQTLEPIERIEMFISKRKLTFMLQIFYQWRSIAKMRLNQSQKASKAPHAQLQQRELISSPESQEGPESQQHRPPPPPQQITGILMNQHQRPKKPANDLYYPDSALSSQFAQPRNQEYFTFNINDNSTLSRRNQHAYQLLAKVLTKQSVKMELQRLRHAFTLWYREYLYTKLRQLEEMRDSRMDGLGQLGSSQIESDVHNSNFGDMGPRKERQYENEMAESKQRSRERIYDMPLQMEQQYLPKPRLVEPYNAAGQDYRGREINEITPGFRDDAAMQIIEQPTPGQGKGSVSSQSASSLRMKHQIPDQHSRNVGRQEILDRYDPNIAKYNIDRMNKFISSSHENLHMSDLQSSNIASTGNFNLSKIDQNDGYISEDKYRQSFLRRERKQNFMDRSSLQHRAKSELNSHGSLTNTRRGLVVPIRNTKPPLPNPSVMNPSIKKVMFKLDDNSRINSPQSRSPSSRGRHRSRDNRGYGTSSGRSSPLSSLYKHSQSYQNNPSNYRMGEDSDLEALRALRSHYRKFKKGQKQSNSRIPRRSSSKQKKQAKYDNPSSKGDREVKNILIHKNQALLRRILHEWNLYALKAFKKRMVHKIKKINNDEPQGQPNGNVIKIKKSLIHRGGSVRSTKNLQKSSLSVKSGMILERNAPLQQISSASLRPRHYQRASSKVRNRAEIKNAGTKTLRTPKQVLVKALEAIPHQNASRPPMQHLKRSRDPDGANQAYNLPSHHKSHISTTDIQSRPVNINIKKKKKDGSTKELLRRSGNSQSKILSKHNSIPSISR